MKRIGLFLTSGPSAGGAFQYSLAMLSALLALPGDEFSLVVAYIDPLWKKYLPAQTAIQLPLSPGKVATILAQFWTASGCSLSLWRRWTRRFHTVVKEVLRQGCDLWVFPSQDFWSSQFPVASVVAIHDLMHRYESKFQEVSGHGRFRYREAYLADVYRSAQGVLVDSELGKQQVHESYEMPSERIFVLPYIPPRYVYENQASPDFDARYRLPSKYIFYPAQFWQHKNHIGIVRALAKVRKVFPDIQLVLAGSKEKQYHEVLQQVQGLELQQHVLFLGYVPEIDIPELYRRARALVLPTFFGPTNIPPLEAFVLGCPVAVSRIYAMPEQVGDAALMFDPNSVDEMASCISRLWSDDDLCRHLAAKGTRKAASWGQSQFNGAVRNIVQRLTNNSKLKAFDQITPASET